MKHLTKFDTEANYNSVKSDLHIPNVSWCVVQDKCKYKEYFHFKDPLVESILATKIGDGIGTTLEQIRACTSIEDWFVNSAIEYFDEFKYFTGITEIGYGGHNYSLIGGSFKSCSSLKSIKLPISLTKIGLSTNGPFDYCSNLEFIDLSKVTNIYTKVNDGNSGFRQCSKLKNVIYNDNVEMILGHRENTLLQLNALPSNIKKLYKNTFRSCSNLKLYEIPAGFTTLGAGETYGGAFANCNKIPFLHFLPSTPPSNLSSDSSTGHFYNTSFKIYVGNGSSAEHDNAILNAYLEIAGWALYSSRLKTWYSFLNS